MKARFDPITKHTFRGSLFRVALRAMTRELEMRQQRTFVYCPRCNFEMCSMNNAIEKDDETVIHVCKNCGASSHWDYDFPAPLNIT